MNPKQATELLMAIRKIVHEELEIYHGDREAQDIDPLVDANVEEEKDEIITEDEINQ